MSRDQKKLILKKSKEDFAFFCDNFIKISHPLKGIIPFKLFGYQKNSIKTMQNERFVIFKKPRQCFEANSQVWLVNGPKPIQDVVKGDLLWSYDTKKNKIIATKINNVFVTNNAELKPCVKIQTINGHESICTYDHQYLTNTGWKEAGTLNRNDYLISTNKKLEVYKDRIKSMKLVEPFVKLYDLEVLPFNNFIIDGAVVHNSGLSTLTGVFALWQLMFNNYKTVLVVSRKDDDSKEFLKRNIKIPYGYLPNWIKNVWGKPEPDNEHQFGFKNGSVVKSLTSNKEVIRSNAASLIIIDESAFMRDMDDMWGAGYPSLTHGGRCIQKNSLILAKSGLKTIQELQNSKENIIFDGQEREILASYDGKIVETTKITTKHGHFIETTPDHKLMALDEDGYIVWKQIKDLTLKDELILSCNYVENGSEVMFDTNVKELIKNECKCKSPKGCNSCRTSIALLKEDHLMKSLNEDLALLLGIIWGDGFIQPNGRFGVSCNRLEVEYINLLYKLIEKFGLKYVEEITPKDYGVRFYSKTLALLLKLNNIVKSKSLNLSIPNAILRSPNKIKAAFLRGLFEADGSISHTPRCTLVLSSGSISLMRQVQIILLSFGIRSSISSRQRKNGFSDNISLRLKNKDEVLKFKKHIGFMGPKKIERLNNIKEGRNVGDNLTNIYVLEEFYSASKNLPSNIRQGILSRIRKKSPSLTRKYIKSLLIYPQLYNTIAGEIVSRNLFTEKIISLEKSNNKVCDIQIKDIQAYNANGFMSHNCLVVSTAGAINNWYWRTWNDAINGKGIFKPIDLQWYNMDWVIEDKKDKIKIAPTDGVRECKTREEQEMYGKYVSPWLMEQRKALIDGDDDSRFRRECLSQFIGVGKSVISPMVIQFYQQNTIEPPKHKVNIVEYTHPNTGETLTLDFSDKLWIWELPSKQKKSDTMYIVSGDVATGEGLDYSTIEVFDIVNRIQIAEWQGYIRPKLFAYMLDYVGRLYNNAMVVVERSGIGFDTVEELYKDLNYPNMYIEKRKNAMMAHVKRKRLLPGFATSSSTKPLVVKALKDNLNEDGYIIKSSRLLEEMAIFSHLSDNKIGAEPGKGNYDDLMMATGIAFYASKDALLNDPRYFTFYTNTQDFNNEESSEPKVVDRIEVSKRDIINNIILGDPNTKNFNIIDEQDKFCLQLGSVQPITQNKVTSNILKEKINRLKRRRL